MDKTTIYYKKGIKLNNPIMIVGLPGIGNVGNLVAQYLKNELKAKRFATLYSPHFPYQIITLKSGKFRLVSNRFYYYKNPNRKHSDVILLLGDYQATDPKGQYEVNERIVEFFKFLGGDTIYTIGGYSSGNQYVQKPRVFGVATGKELIVKLKKIGVKFGGIGGISVLGTAGMVVAFSKKHHIPAACVMGETGLLDVDANSAKSVLKIVSKIMGITVNLTNMEHLQKETEKLLGDLADASKNPQAGQQGEALSSPRRDDLNYIR